MSQANHLNLDLGTPRVLYLNRALLGAASTDRRDEEGNRTLQQMAAIERGFIRKFIYQGKEVQLLNPKKDELDLWTVVIENDSGQSSWRLDMILGSMPMNLASPQPTKVAEGVKQAIQDGDYIPADE